MSCPLCSRTVPGPTGNKTNKETHMKTLLAGSLLIALALAGGCGKSQSTTAGSGSDEQSKDSAAEIDKHGEEIMASSTKAEAREWMKQPKHVFFKADPKVVAQFVE